MDNLIYNSTEIIDSNIVVESQKISGSRHVFYSSDVIDSIEVVGSNIVKNSKQIFGSSIITNSNKVYRSSNVNDSENVVGSITIVNGRSLIDSMLCFDCSEIIRSKSLENCFFCFDCTDSTNLMFCKGLENSEYCIFNKPVGKRQFDLFVRQYKDFMNDMLAFAREWPNESARSESPFIRINFKLWYDPISKEFWKWARTLPHFDSMLLYSITMNQDFLNDSTNIY